jgi:ribose transport system substrate-binding protein
VIGRRKAVEETLKDSGIEIVKKLSADWTEAEAERVVSSWLKLRGTSSGSIDLVGAQNDSIAMGARKAILAHRPEWAKVPFTGVDGLKEEGALLVKQGVLAATIAKPPNAGKGVELAARALRGEPMPPSATLPVLSIPTIEELIRKYR